MMIKKTIIAFTLLLVIFMTAACENKENTFKERNDIYSELRDKYYCDVYMEGTFRQAWKINIEDGSILTACPDPLCGHGNTDDTCPFRKVIPLLIADGGRYMFYVGYSGGEHNIYVFDTEANTTEKIYEYDKLPSSNPQLLYGEGRLYFDIPQIKTSDGDYIETAARTLMYYDINTKEIKEYGKKNDSQQLLFEYKGKLCYQDDTGKFLTDGSFDDSDPLPLPEGGELGILGYWACGPGYVAKSYSPADIYLYDENRSITLPEEAADSILVGLTATGDTFYFTLGGSEPTDKYGGHYITKICILNKNGSYKIYTVQSDFSFYVKKGYGDCVVCSVLSEYKDGVYLSPGTGEDNTPNNLMWIDLQSGKASLYNTYSDSVLDMHLGDITVKTERIK